ncbi:MAG TPA: branched-chain amino acid ABC transporter permease, partial [Anaerolineae bacterium]|nr:branched-chain amino acid ABC transporter permease [Anaerolineae bacterium]
MHLPSTNVLIQVIIVGVLTGGVYALMAAGLTLIFGVMRVINIAHGAFLIFSAYLSYWLFSIYGLDPFLSVIVTVPLLFVIGIVFQQHLLARVRNEPGLMVLLTFSLAITLEGVMGALWQTTGRSVRTWYTSEVWKVELAELTLRLPVIRVAGFVAAVIALFLLYLLMT